MKKKKHKKKQSKRKKQKTIFDKATFHTEIYIIFLNFAYEQ